MLTKLQLEELMVTHQVPAMSVALIEKGMEHFFYLSLPDYSEISENNLFSACSMSKLVTVLLTLKLADSDLLDLDKPLTAYWQKRELSVLGEVPNLRQLLSHLGGIKDSEGSFENLTLKTKSEFFEIVDQPNQTFAYSDAGYAIIQDVIEEALDKSFENSVQLHLFDQLGMTHSRYINHPADFRSFEGLHGYNSKNQQLTLEESIYPYPSGSGLWSTAKDMLKLIVEINNGSRGNSRLELPKSTYEALLSVQHPDCPWLGLGLFLDNEGQREYYSKGWGVGFQSMLIGFPDCQRGIVILTNKDSGQEQLKGIFGDIYRLIQKD